MTLNYKQDSASAMNAKPLSQSSPLPFASSQSSKDTPRVLHIISGMGKGGAEKVVTQLACWRGGNAGIVWFREANPWEPSLSEAGVFCEQTPIDRLTEVPRAVKRIAQIIREGNYDIVHTHLLHAHIIGRWAARMARVPVMATLHNLRRYSQKSLRPLVPLDVRASRYNSTAVAVSEAVKQRCLSLGYRAPKIEVIYNGIELPAVGQAPLPQTTPLLAMVGRLRIEKGPDLFIEMMGMLPEAQGILMGDGQERDSIRRLLETSPARDRLRWELDGNVEAAMRKAALVVVPSRHEGLGLVALEAMSLGRPVVATRTGGLPEVVQDGVTGLLVPPNSAQELATATRRLLTDPDLRVEMGSAGRQRVQENFTLERMLTDYDRVYNEVAGKCAIVRTEK